MRFCYYSFYDLLYFFSAVFTPEGMWLALQMSHMVVPGNHGRRSLQLYISQEVETYQQARDIFRKYVKVKTGTIYYLIDWDDIRTLMLTDTGLAVTVKSSHAMKVNNATIVQNKNWVSFLLLIIVHLRKNCMLPFENVLRVFGW